jgi:hypothetical protein
MCSINGRQVGVRDLNTDKMNFVPIKDPLERVTCMTSSCSREEKQVLAVAYVELDYSDTVSIEIYCTNDPDRIVPDPICNDRFKFKLPKIEPPPVEEKKSAH